MNSPSTRTGSRRDWSRMILAASALYCGVGLAYAVFRTPSSTGIVCDAPVADYGHLPLGSNYSQTFVVENRSPTDCQIKAIVPACACTIVDSLVFPISLKSGQTLNVPVVLQGKRPLGLQTRNLRVITDRPGDPGLVLSLQGEIVSQFKLSPSRIDLETLNTAHEVSARAQIQTVNKTPFKILGCAASIPELKVRVDDSQRDGQTVIHIETRNKLPAGTLRGYAVVEAESTVGEYIHLLIDATVEGAAVCEPDVLFIEDPAREFKMELKVRSHEAGTRCEIEGFELPGHKVTAASPNEQDRSRLLIRVSGNSHDLHRKNLRLHTTHGDLLVPICIAGRDDESTGP